MNAWQICFLIVIAVLLPSTTLHCDPFAVKQAGQKADRSAVTEQDTIRELIRVSQDSHRRNSAEGLAAGEEAYRRAVSLGDTILQLRALNVIGANRWMQGAYDLAVRDHIEALRLAELLRSDIDIGRSYNNLGLAYRNLGMTDRAEQCFRRSVEIRARIGDTAGQARGMMNLGLILFESRRFDSSYALHARSLELAQGVADSLLIAGNQYYLGRIENAWGNTSAAMQLMRAARTLYESLNDRNGISLVSSDIARVLFHAGNRDEARTIAMDALKNALLLNSRFAIREATQILSEVHAAGGEFRKAYDYLVLYKAADDSLRDEAALRRAAQLNIERQIAVREKEIAFEARKKEIQIQSELRSEAVIRNSLIAGTILLATLLSVLLFAYRGKLQSNTLITEQKRRIEETNSELAREIETRERLFGIVSHDLRGPVGNINGMLDLAADEKAGISAEQRMELLGAARETAQASLALLNRLLEWARAQRKEIVFRPEMGDLRGVADSVLQLLLPQAKARRIRIHWDCPNAVECAFDEHMMTVILENLLSNAIKFTGENGEVELRMERSDDHCIIQVADNGPGIDAERLARIRKRTGVVPEASVSGEGVHGLGLDLCHRFTALHGGEITVESETGKGSVFTVRFPVNHMEA